MSKSRYLVIANKLKKLLLITSDERARTNNVFNVGTLSLASSTMEGKVADTPDSNTAISEVADELKSLIIEGLMGTILFERGKEILSKATEKVVSRFIENVENAIKRTRTKMDKLEPPVSDDNTEKALSDEIDRLRNEIRRLSEPRTSAKIKSVMDLHDNTKKRIREMLEYNGGQLGNFGLAEDGVSDMIEIRESAFNDMKPTPNFMKGITIMGAWAKRDINKREVIGRYKGKLYWDSDTSSMSEEEAEYIYTIRPFQDMDGKDVNTNDDSEDDEETDENYNILDYITVLVDARHHWSGKMNQRWSLLSVSDEEVKTHKKDGPKLKLAKSHVQNMDLQNTYDVAEVMLGKDCLKYFANVVVEPNGQIRAITKINKGDELFIDYGIFYWKGDKNEATKKPIWDITDDCSSKLNALLLNDDFIRKIARTSEETVLIRSILIKALDVRTKNSRLVKKSKKNKNTERDDGKDEEGDTTRNETNKNRLYVAKTKYKSYGEDMNLVFEGFGNMIFTKVTIDADNNEVDRHQVPVYKFRKFIITNEYGKDLSDTSSPVESSIAASNVSVGMDIGARSTKQPMNRNMSFGPRSSQNSDEEGEEEDDGSGSDGDSEEGSSGEASGSQGEESEEVLEDDSNVSKETREKERIQLQRLNDTDYAKMYQTIEISDANKKKMDTFKDELLAIKYEVDNALEKYTAFTKLNIIENQEEGGKVRYVKSYISSGKTVTVAYDIDSLESDISSMENLIIKISNLWKYAKKYPNKNVDVINIFKKLKSLNVHGGDLFSNEKKQVDSFVKRWTEHYRSLYKIKKGGDLDIDIIDLVNKITSIERTYNENNPKLAINDVKKIKDLSDITEGLSKVTSALPSYISSLRRQNIEMHYMVSSVKKIKKYTGMNKDRIRVSESIAKKAEFLEILSKICKNIEYNIKIMTSLPILNDPKRYGDQIAITVWGDLLITRTFLMMFFFRHAILNVFTYNLINEGSDKIMDNSDNSMYSGVNAYKNYIAGTMSKMDKRIFNLYIQDIKDVYESESVYNAEPVLSSTTFINLYITKRQIEDITLDDNSWFDHYVNIRAAYIADRTENTSDSYDVLARDEMIVKMIKELINNNSSDMDPSSQSLSTLSFDISKTDLNSGLIGKYSMDKDIINIFVTLSITSRKQGKEIDSFYGKTSKKPDITSSSIGPILLHEIANNLRSDKFVIPDGMQVMYFKYFDGMDILYSVISGLFGRNTKIVGYDKRRLAKTLSNVNKMNLLYYFAKDVIRIMNPQGGNNNNNDDKQKKRKRKNKSDIVMDAAEDELDRRMELLEPKKFTHEEKDLVDPTQTQKLTSNSLLSIIPTYDNASKEQIEALAKTSVIIINEHTPLSDTEKSFITKYVFPVDRYRMGGVPAGPSYLYSVQQLVFNPSVVKETIQAKFVVDGSRESYPFVNFYGPKYKRNDTAKVYEYTRIN